MSIYLAKKQLVELLDKSKLDYSVVLDNGRNIAATKKGKILDYDNYTEEKLQHFVEKNKNCYVDIEFWNYNYCTSRNLDPEISCSFVDNLNVVVKNLNDFSTGTLVVLIIVNEIILNTFKIKDNSSYLEYLEDIKISRKIIKNFMLNMEYRLPLTSNYLTLILEVFDEETIYDFIFRECCNFTINEFEKIMEYYTVKDINIVSFYIFDRFKNNKLRLEYIQKCLILYENKIYLNRQIVFSKKNKNPTIGYYLMRMKIDKEIENLYYSVMRLYLDKSGTLDIIVSDDKKDNKFIRRRKEEIFSYFDKF